MRAKRCETCGAWETYGASGFGFCHKKPPEILVVTTLPNGEGLYQTLYPETTRDRWCLEWVPKEDDPGDVLERGVKKIKCMMPVADSIDECRGISEAINHIINIIEEERNREA